MAPFPIRVYAIASTRSWIPLSVENAKSRSFPWIGPTRVVHNYNVFAELRQIRDNKETEEIGVRRQVAKIATSQLAYSDPAETILLAMFEADCNMLAAGCRALERSEITK